MGKNSKVSTADALDFLEGALEGDDDTAAAKAGSTAADLWGILSGKDTPKDESAGFVPRLAYVVEGGIDETLVESATGTGSLGFLPVGSTGTLLGSAAVTGGLLWLGSKLLGK